MDERISLKKYVPEENTRKTFGRVFDKSTINAVHKLALRGFIDHLEFVISTGKEAHVFRAVDRAGNFRAVKIYKTLTTDFKHMINYIAGDERFKHVPKDRRELVFAWTRKESKNLEKARNAGVRVPLAIGYTENALVMEFIGSEEGVAAKTMKEVGVGNLDKAYSTIIEWIARMYKTDLIHSDLSEYNVLVNETEKGEEELVLIDIGQAVLTTHPKAREFFERDVRNISKYFSKKGLEKDYEEVYREIKEAKERL